MGLRTGKWLSLVAAGMLVLSVAGCEFIEEHPKAFAGAGIGAVGGAVVGGLAKGEKGAIWGGLIGALAGGAVGAYLDHKDKTAAETYEDYGYDPAAGVEVRLISVRAEPTRVAPGEEVMLRATFAVMAPNPAQAVEVSEKREVTLGPDVVANLGRTSMRTPGTYTSSVPLRLPAGAAAGVYTVRVTVSAAGESSQMTTTFQVE